MDNELNKDLENQVDTNPEQAVEENKEVVNATETAYADPNKEVSQEYSYGADNNQQINYSNQNSNYQQNMAQSGNYTYNTSVNETEELDNSPMEMKDWLLTLLAAFIPCCVGTVLYCVWAFGKKGNINRRNFCRAALVIQGASVVVWLIFFLIWGGALLSMINSSSYYY